MPFSNFTKTLSSIICLLIASNTYGQLSTAYGFSSTAGTYTEITGGTVIATATATGTSTSATSLANQSYAITLPFTFNFNGSNYTTGSINSNGAFHFGACVTVPACTTNTPMALGAGNSFATVSAFGKDIHGNHRFIGTRTSGSPTITGVANTIGINVGAVIIGTGIPAGATVLSKTVNSVTLSANASTGSSTVLAQMGEIRTETLHSSPNRVFVIQWRSFGTASTSENNLINFQIRLSENGNIQFVYGNIIRNASFTNSIEVGLRSGTSAQNFFRTTSPSNDWSNTADGTGYLLHCSFSSSVAPSAGLTYNWPPLTCPSPASRTSSNVQVNTATIGWASLGAAASYDYEVRFSGLPGSGTNGLIANGNTTSTSANITGLSGSTTYSYYVRSVCGPSDIGLWTPASTFLTVAAKTLGTITATQTSTVVLNNTNNVNLYRLAFPVSGSGGTLTLNMVSLTSKNTNDADVTGVTLWSGTSSTPSAQLSSTTYSGGIATFSGLTLDLPVASNTYFWIRYNVAANTADGSLLDLRVNAGGIEISAVGGAISNGTQPPANLDAAGQVEVTRYCIPDFTSGCGSSDAINSFSLNTLSNSATGCIGSAPSFASYYAGASTTALTAGQSYTATMVSGSGSGNHRAALWVDFNHNDSFLDAGEFFPFNNNGNIAASTTATVSVPVPSNALSGVTRIRVRYIETSTNLVQTNLCTSYSYGETEDYRITVALPTTTWTGTSGNDWFISGNWTAGVPAANVNTVIPDVSGASNNFPIITGITVASVRDVTIDAGASLTINVPAQLSIYGNISNGGNSNFGNGDITFSKSGTVTLSNPLEVNGTVTIASGTHLVTNGNLTIGSGGQLVHGTDFGSALTDYGTISNDAITIKRTGYSGNVLWNFWGSPVEGANVNVLGGSLYYYDPLSATNPNTTSGLQAGWKNAAGAMIPGRGYISKNGGTVSFNGTVSNWNNNPIVLANISAGAGVNGVPYNLLGNPFPSAMSATEFMETNGPAIPFGGNGTVTGAMWFWDDDASSGSGYSKTDFAAWTQAGGVAGPNNSSKTPNGHIATGQGFYVEKTSVGSASVSFTNNMRSTTNTVFFRQEPIKRLWVNVTNSQGLYNEVLIAFIDDATDGYDAGYDAKKMRGNANIALYTKLNGKDYMIQAYGDLIADKVVELGLDAGLTGTHTLSMKQIESLDETVVPMLEDRLTNTWQNLRVNPSYNFTVTTPGTIAERFFIHFSAPLEIETIPESCTDIDGQITLTQNSSQYWSYMLVDDANNLIQYQDAFNGTATISGLESGNYTLRLVDKYGYQVTKSITVDGKQKINTDFVISASTVLVDETVQFTNQSAGATTYEWDFGDGSTPGGVENPIHQYSEEGTYTVMLRASNEDCYQNKFMQVNVQKLSTAIAQPDEESVKVFSYEKKVFVKFDFSREEKAQLSVMNILGEEVYEQFISTKGNYEIDLSNQPNETYFVIIKTASETYHAKVVLMGKKFQ